MGIWESLSRLKKKLKRLGSKRKSDRTGAGSGERPDPADSLSQAAPHVVAGSAHDRENSRTDADGWEIRSTDGPPPPDVPEPEPACGENNDQEGEGGDVNEGEVNQKYSHPHADIEVVAGSGPEQEGDVAGGEKTEQAYPSPTTPLIVRSGKPDSM